MSCLNLRLPPAKKAWKSFATKLLHKLHMSKAIKKPKYRSPNTTAYASSKALLFEKRDKKRRRLVPPSKQRHSSRFQFQRKSVPVYIDKLFQDQEPVVTELVTKFPPREKISAAKRLDQLATTTTIVPETSMEYEVKGGDQMGADDMWESLGFASPQLQGIDERAEQFILSFRAEMQIQEMRIARGS